MYFQDLSPYTYLNKDADPTVLNIGWLDDEHEFPKGNIADNLLTRILALCFQSVNQTRGYHCSPFLEPLAIGYPVEFKEKRRNLGSAEIRVTGKPGLSYAAPNLIYHYIKDCNYLPPQEFLDALASMEIDV